MLRQVTAGLILLLPHPHSPAHLNVHNPTLSDEQTESFTFTIQDAHRATTPLAASTSLRSVAHEPPREPCRLRGGGSHRREYACRHAGLDHSHTHIDDVPGAPPPRLSQAHSAADAPLCSTGSGCRGRITPCHPVCTSCDVKVLAYPSHKNVAFSFRNVKSSAKTKNNYLIIWLIKKLLLSL